MVALVLGALAIASVYWQGDGHQYARTASGAKYDPTSMTVAHKTLPFGKKLLLHHGSNCAEVKVNDRGPFVKGRDFDLTPAVAKALHFSGLGRIRVEPWPPLPTERPVVVAQALLYCWYPTDNGTKRPPTCALEYQQCQKLVSSYGGSCKTQ